MVRYRSASRSPKTCAVPVTVRALSQRINRLLAVKGEELKKTRGTPARATLGSYYLLRGNSVFADHVDLEALGRETGALADYERLLIED